MFIQTQKGYWLPVVNWKPTRAVVANQQTLINFYKKEYDKIFPEFVKGRGVVTLREIAADVYILLETECGSEGGVALPKRTFTIIRDNEWEVCLKPIAPISDIYIEMGDNTLAEDISTFFESREAYADLNIKHRRAALIYGVQGNGKTTTIRQITKDFDGYVFYLSSSFSELSDLTRLQEILKGENIIFVFEELTQHISEFKEEILSFLDGELSWANTYVIATTNYPEELDKNIVSRPGRFNTLLEFKSPDATQRMHYLRSFFEVVTDETIEQTKGFTVDFLREIVILSKLKQLPLIMAIKRVKEMQNVVKTNFSQRGTLGF